MLSYHEKESPISHLRRYEIVKGDVIETLPAYLKRHPETVIALAYFDLDLYQPTKSCLQVLKGSHHLGRIDHIKVGDQTGADMERVNIAMERLELVHCELEPGSAIFFHCNLLHCSAQNRSPSS